MVEVNKVLQQKIEEKVSQGEDFLAAWISEVLKTAMGKCLDLTRITEISDRAQLQLERTLKDYFYSLIDLSIAVLTERGYIKKDAKDSGSGT